VKLCSLLSDLRWGCWKLFELPYVVKLTSQLLDCIPTETLEMLVALHRAQRLNDADQNWKLKFENWAASKLGGWTRSEENVSVQFLSSGISNRVSELGRMALYATRAEQFTSFNTTAPGADHRGHTPNERCRSRLRKVTSERSVRTTDVHA